MFLDDSDERSELLSRRKKVLEMADLRKELQSNISKLELQSLQNDYYLLYAVKGSYSKHACGTSMLYEVTNDAIKFIHGTTETGKIDKRKKSPEKDAYNQIIATLEIMMGLGLNRGHISHIRDIIWYGLNHDKVEYYFYIEGDETNTEFRLSIPVFKNGNFCPTVNGNIPMDSYEYLKMKDEFSIMFSNIKTNLSIVKERKDHYMSLETISEFPSYDTNIAMIEDFGKVIREKLGIICDENKE